MNPAPQRGASVNPTPHNWFYVYLLRSKKSGRIYVGCTSNLHKRLEEHKLAKNYSTRNLLPFELVYVEAYKSKKDAFQREKRLKHYGSALRNLKSRLKNTFDQGGAG